MMIISSDFSIDNISVKEITDDTDIPRINYEDFSYEDVLGEELVTNGGFDTDSDWISQNGWSIENGISIFIGTVSLYRKLYQENILTIGKMYKLTFDIVSINSGSIKNFSQSNPTSYGTIGTKTEYFIATYDDLFLEPTNNANLTIDNISVKEVTQQIVEGSGTAHWLLEPESTNLISYSEDFSQWNKNGDNSC